MRLVECAKWENLGLYWFADSAAVGWAWPERSVSQPINSVTTTPRSTFHFCFYFFFAASRRWRNRTRHRRPKGAHESFFFCLVSFSSEIHQKRNTLTTAAAAAQKTSIKPNERLGSSLRLQRSVSVDVRLYFFFKFAPQRRSGRKREEAGRRKRRDA